MYLAGMLEPDFRTIADFRKDHLRQIKQYFRKIVEIAVIAGVSSFAQISIDRSKIKANTSKKCLKTEEKLDEHIEDVERQIAAHLEKAVQTDEEEDKECRHGGSLSSSASRADCPLSGVVSFRLFWIVNREFRGEFDMDIDFLTERNYD